MKLILLACFVAASNALIFCPSNFCDAVRCAQVTDEQCNGRVARKGGVCGCCDVCVQQIEEGETCAELFLLGAPLKSECKGNELYCEPKSKACTKKTCAMRQKEVQARLDESRKNGRPLLGLSVPRCEDDESYSGKQCMGSMCCCTSSKGEMIPGHCVFNWLASDMANCECARDRFDYKKLGIIGKMFHCTSEGNYEDVQCQGSVCFCADKKTGKALLGAKSVHISQKQMLQC